MRIVIMLMLALALAGVLALFPHVSDQPIRIEAFGWIFETQQGPFILLLLLLLGLFWMLRRILSAFFAGPGQVWQLLRSGGRSRREANLREGLSKLIDGHGDSGIKAFRKTGGFIPDWGSSLLRTLAMPVADYPMPSPEDNALITALRARVITDPSVSAKVDLTTRKAYLEAWLHAHPGAPLALYRNIDLAEEEKDWETLTHLLGKMWKKGGSAAASIRPRLTSAYIALAKTQPDHALEHLRKAHQLTPANEQVVLLLGKAMFENSDTQACRKLWSVHLETHDDDTIATALHEILCTDALKAYRKLEKVSGAKMTPARAWLRAQLAHDARLDGLAMDHMQELIKSYPRPLVWKTLGNWCAEKADWLQAAGYYQKALGIVSEGSEVDIPEKVD